MSWMSQAFSGIHYDLHANADDTELGRELTPEHLRDALAKLSVDWIQCDCKGHAGYTSWPTKVGSTSPGVVRDALRIHRDVTRELGIRLGMHYSGVWDSRAVELHPEWAVVHADGSRSPNYTCRLSAYVDELMIPQMLELIDVYNIDGFWVDGENWATTPCWCDRCRAEFMRRTGIAAIPTAAGQPHWDAWLAFHRDLFTAYVTRYTEAVHARDPECQVCSNWLYTARQPDAIEAPVDYISGDFDWAFGATRAAIEGRIMDARGLPWNLMAWGFVKTRGMGENPPWTMKSVTHLCQEVSEVLALGGAVMIYNSPQRTGWLTGWHQEILAQVGAFCHARKERCFGTKTVPQAAVLHLASHYYAGNAPLYNYGEALQPVEGALHALLENHWSTDVLTEDVALKRLAAYPLVVVPEQTRLTPAMETALQRYVEDGGRLLMSGPHLAEAHGGWLGVAPAGEPLPSTYLCSTDGEVVPVSGPWQPVLLEDCGATIEHLRQQEPEKDGTDQAAMTLRGIGAGVVAAIHGPVFRDYFLGHYPRLRRLLGEVLAGLDAPRTVELEAPPRLELVLRQRDDQLVIHLVNRGAGEMLNDHRVVVEELPPVTDVVLRVQRDTAPARIDIFPPTPGTETTVADGVVTIRLPSVEIHTVITVQ
jgi:alpha-L-fucosidase